jgi:hypothetical protein
MNAISDLAGKATRFVGKNSSVILTGVGVAGVITTAFLTGKAAYKAAQLIQAKETEADDVYEVPLTAQEKFELVWKLYIPPTVMAFATVTAIIFSHRIEYRRGAAIAAAYAISERGWEEYKDKIVEKLGPKKEQAARDEVAQDAVTRNPPVMQTVIVGEGDSLCMDGWTGRYFRSTMERVKTAMVDTNTRAQREDWASLSSFYDELGLAHTQESDDIGWTPDALLDLSFSYAGDDTGKPVMVVMYKVQPYHY